VYRFREPQRGDVVAIRYSGYHNLLMKRIVGLPGETVEFRDGHLYINGKLLDEPYLKRPSSWNNQPETVGPFELYVVGDNRSMPIDLHEHGRAERSRVLGKVLL
jgi:signal peptidase I